MVAAPTDRPADDTWPDRVGRLERRLTRERSARQQAEQLLETRSGELWQERERYRLLVENSSDVVFQVAPDDT
jgi:PAS domain-containing protein